MGYRDDFYIVANIIGFTGTIQSDATVYFRQGPEFGHITQAHRFRPNVGREGVCSHPGYVIGNERYDGDLRCVERTGPGEEGILHVSRNPFVGSAGLSPLFASLLSRSIINFIDRKPMYDMSGEQIRLGLEGEKIPHVSVHHLIRRHRKLIALAGR
jgi:hypothetical protein